MAFRNTPFLDTARIYSFSKFIQSLPKPTSLNFYSAVVGDREVILEESYPSYNAVGVIDFFFFTVIHNFGFWHDDGVSYQGPLYGTWEGRSRVKGSDLLYKIMLRALKDDPERIAPEHLATISRRDHEHMFSDDHGPIPLFNTHKRTALTRLYGQWFLNNDGRHLTPRELVEQANQEYDPVKYLVRILTDPTRGIPSLRIDPLRKKAELLIMSLVNRPEHFLRKISKAYGQPIVDYHDMRLTLRLGHVVLPPAWVMENESRRLTNPRREWEIRHAVHMADKKTIKASGFSRDELDILKWSARKYCPETETPDCAHCVFRSVCAQRTTLFQPVYRTEFY